MRLLSFRRAAVFSFFLHVAFVLFAAAFALRGPVKSPDIYTVRLVSAEAPEPSPKPAPIAEKSPPKQAAEAAAPKEKTAPKTTPKKEAPPRDNTAELMKHKADTLQALREKQEELYKKERIGELRSKVESERAAEPERPQVPASEGERLKILDDYVFEIERNIREHWVFPDIDITGLEAVISITVLKSGFIRINRFERPSGNQLFDRSALRAITRAGRVEPPPFGEDLDVGIRFRPDEP